MYSVVISDNGTIKEVVVCKNEQEAKIVVEERSKIQTVAPVHIDIVKTVSFEDVAEKYDYLFKDRLMNFDELSANLLVEGYTSVEGLDGAYIYTEYLKDKNSLNAFLFTNEEDLDVPLSEDEKKLLALLRENLEMKFFCDYRGGEIEETVFAKSEADALNEVLNSSIQHSEFWCCEISE